MKRAITWSYGGGTQSVAIAVLIAQGRLPRPERIVIADTGREVARTWEYLDAHVQPLLATVGLKVEVAPHSLAAVDLYSHKGDLLIPAFTKTGMLNGYCSGEWKRDVVLRWLRAHGYGPKNPVVTWIGISLDEVGRAKPGKRRWQKLHWPLLFDVPKRRHECVSLVVDFGLPDPPRSRCWKCPYQSDEEWRELRDKAPRDFSKAIQLDGEVRAKDEQGGVYLHRSRVPLAEADLSGPRPAFGGLFGEVGHCDSGFCWT